MSDQFKEIQQALDKLPKKYDYAAAFGLLFVGIVVVLAFS